MDYRKMELTQIAGALRSRDFSARELAEAVFRTIDQGEDRIGAYITLTRESALKQADRVDQLIAGGLQLPPLAGIPGALKDNIATRGIPTTNASRMMKDFIPPYDAFVWRLLRQQEMVLLGKTNMDEFAMGHSTESSAFHPTRNPYDLTRVPGGSSGGSAAAVASGEACFTLGSDTGGSIRQPAALCGLVGLRPTYGLVSRRGVTAFAASLDQVGPMTRSVRDNALVLDAIAVRDRKDVHSLDRQGGSFLDAIGEVPAQLTIGWPESYFASDDLDPQVHDLLEKALRFYESQGLRIIPVDLKTLDASLAAYYILSSAEGFSAMNRYDGIHFGYRSQGEENLEDVYTRSRSEALGPEVKQRILLGSFTLSEDNYRDYFYKAAQARSLVMEEFKKVFQTCQAILTPVTATPAWPLGSLPEELGGSKYSNDRFTLPASLTGMPALSVPLGLTGQGLPVGMQLMGKPFSESLLYQLAALYEDAHGLIPAAPEVTP
ncbi:MAG TPA: Asp-tRNA(Asn)/Glu-tRNA(Gln) amidotransferase subunit GatA [Bacillota bacterium]|jgi:aspartyl-tRNA(Asn)/glutamyl-tRNA(Gln) amidotransferase subunit A|nr:Asp-tRNA(Asn)/Glu-tRNA(Gln) amidotransferase subunit GatA [Fastidiosipila sp.]HPX93614.1 Asp-tRNA(Asn)/Glu-tRNA(Gln) amidotransferase subunit GatA [Bacillota bacterium]HQB81526.1 Asp-tRNA(Asn)/Glu-tRNA(Gln) amidotransferase subunit GatA [Bacillota bacterium]